MSIEVEFLPHLQDLLKGQEHPVTVRGHLKPPSLKYQLTPSQTPPSRSPL